MEDILKEILATLKEPKSEKKTLTIPECIEFMGVSREKIIELINKDNTDFPYFKNGKKILVNKTLLINWLDKISEEHRHL